MSQRRHEAPELASAARRMMRALAVRATEGDTEAIEQLAQLVHDAEQSLATAVAGARERVGYSWTEVAQVVGTTRQNARQRWQSATPPVTFQCEHGCGWLFGSESQRDVHHVREHGVERCAKVTVPKPLRCAMPQHHSGRPHVMAADDQPEPDSLTEVTDTTTGGNA